MLNKTTNSNPKKGTKTFVISHKNGSNNAPTLETTTYSNANQNLIDGKFCNTETFIVSLATKLGISTSSIKLVN